MKKAKTNKGLLYFIILIIFTLALFKCTSTAELNRHYQEEIIDTTLSEQIDSIYQDGDIKRWIDFWDEILKLDTLKNKEVGDE